MRGFLEIQLIRHNDLVLFCRESKKSKSSKTESSQSPGAAFKSKEFITDEESNDQVSNVRNFKIYLRIIFQNENVIHILFITLVFKISFSRTTSLTCLINLVDAVDFSSSRNTCWHESA